VFKKSKPEDGGSEGEKRRLLRSVPRPVVAAVLGILFYVVCSQLPADMHTACETVGKVLPAACGL
jgi:hypothetical protein